MTFTQRRNRLTTHCSERIAVVKRRISVSAQRNRNSADASEKYSVVLHTSGRARIVISKPT